MRRLAIARRIGLSAPILASAALALAFTSPALAGGSQAVAHASKKRAKLEKPRAQTGVVSHVRGTSAVLEGLVDPRGRETTYYFKYGPTAAYGSQTPSVAVGSGTTQVKVSQLVSGFQPGYHYRIFATNSAGTGEGKDRIYTSKTSQLTVVIAKASTREQGPAVYGRPYFVSGILTGPGAANHAIVLQASGYPYHEGFANISAPVLSNSAGRFSFRVPSLLQSTQFRVATTDLRAIYSPVMTVPVAVQVSFHVRATKRRGYVRLYGTVTPSQVKAPVLFQLQKATRPGGKSEASVRFVTELSTVTKKGTASASRFSIVVSVRHGGRYRAFVKLPKGALVSGYSSTVAIHGAPPPKKHKKGKAGKRKRG